MASRELAHVSETVQKIMLLNQQEKKKNFVIQVPKTHHIKEFEDLLTHMLIQYKVPVKTKVQEVPVEIKCRCGFSGVLRSSGVIPDQKPPCPECKSNRTKIISPINIEIL